MEKILKYFPNITPEQKRQLEMLGPLYEDWNAKINVISRKDISNLYEHHVLHSLAILFPEASFKLIDRTAKKIRVAQEVAQAIGLRNVTAVQLSGEEEKGKFDFVVSRAVMPLPDLVRIVRKNIAREQQNAHPNGLVVLKGGDLTAELRPFRGLADREPLCQWFDEEWFKEKELVYLPL